ncbi:MAG: hypothetical protein ACOC6C_03110 [Verrucomicrobiota bacterium]
MKKIWKELRLHAPFTIFGALTGILFIAFFQAMPAQSASTVFYVLHPIHVVLSALATASMYRLHTCERISGVCIKGHCNLWFLLVIGYLGSVGIATLSDSIIPYIGELLMNLPNRGMHLGFIEKWWLVNPLAVVGVIIACYRPLTKFPHAGHVLLSTWASLFHIIMAVDGQLTWVSYLVVFVFLFLAVWLPCCVSDIVFPLIVASSQKKQVHDAAPEK